MASLVRDVLLLIFTELNDLDSLHSCSLVNKNWCQVAVPLLWKSFSDTYENPYNYKRESRKKFYNVIAHFLPNNPKDLLPQNNILLPLNKFPKEPMFKYMDFLTSLSTVWIEDMAKLLINDEVGSKYKERILEFEIYKLIFNRCNNAKNFHWYTKKRLYRYPNAKNFFSKLRSLEISPRGITSKTLIKLGKICQNLTNLEIHMCDEDTPGLASFIKIQKKLQSLCLEFDEENDEVEEQYILLGNIIEKKASTLKKVIIQPIITLISPIFVLSLKNIQYLALSNEYGELYENVELCEWKRYLNMASFPDLQYLETTCLPSSITCLIIEKSGRNILEINIHSPLESESDNRNLIEVISIYCPKLIKLTVNVDYKNLGEMSKIFSSCKQLEKLYLTTNVNILPNGDELLRVMSEASPMVLQEFKFGDKWNFSLKGLESFFETWKSKNRPPIKFSHNWDELVYSWTDDHDKMVEKYMKV
ncbi:hypothetical protein RhiirA4_464465 [Rhizophagus irregularis]|uniref:F-box domain-containing protein n=1 Tax=Rhizophagus irregularis TaxID=588596 RepID=A0A2I1GQ57_9GLOM|nr:hypothetical protein RhiirA4_464465 [Rhizophagus irregularis]